MLRDIYILWFGQLERNAVEGAGFRKNDFFYLSAKRLVSCSLTRHPSLQGSPRLPQYCLSRDRNDELHPPSHSRIWQIHHFRCSPREIPDQFPGDPPQPLSFFCRDGPVWVVRVDPKHCKGSLKPFQCRVRQSLCVRYLESFLFPSTSGPMKGHGNISWVCRSKFQDVIQFALVCSLDNGSKHAFAPF